MAKVCKVCGVKYRNNAERCVMCKTEFNDLHIYKRRRRNIILAVCITLLLVSTVSYAVYSTTPSAAVRRIMSAYNRADVDEVVSYYPEFYLESDNIDKRRLLLDVETDVKIFSKYLCTYYLESPATPSWKECEKLLEDLRYYGGENFDEEKLGEIKMIWVNFKYDIEGIWPKGSIRFIVFEYEGRWCWLPQFFFI